MKGQKRERHVLSERGDVEEEAEVGPSTHEGSDVILVRDTAAGGERDKKERERERLGIVSTTWHVCTRLGMEQGTRRRRWQKEEAPRRRE